MNDAGRAQARVLARELRGTRLDAVYASDLQRAFETAVIVAEPHEIPVLADPGLREIDVGSWSGLTRSELEQRFPHGDRPDGESREEHAERVLAAVERIARKHPSAQILIVTHGGTMRALRTHVSDEPFHPIVNCAVLELHFRDDRLALPIR